MKVFITQTLEQEAVKLLEKFAEVKSSGVDRPLTRSEFLEGIRDADAAIFVWHTEQMDREAFDAAPNLKIIARRGVGYDNFDLEEAKRRGVRVTVTPVHMNTIADLTFGLLLSAARRIHRADAFVRSGQWTEGGVWVARKFMGYDVHQKTIGIVGFGKIGKLMAKRAKGFDMNVLYYDVRRQPEAERELDAKYADLEDLLSRSDFVSVNCALTDSTRNLINRDRISKMKDGAVLVVTARGGIVDEQALYEALTSGKLGGAGLDVFEPEPIRPDNPLLRLENVVFTPHLGASVYETRLKMAVTAVDDVIRVLSGEQPAYPLI